MRLRGAPSCLAYRVCVSACVIVLHIHHMYVFKASQAIYARFYGFTLQKVSHDQLSHGVGSVWYKII